MYKMRKCELRVYTVKPVVYRFNGVNSGVKTRVKVS